MAQQSITPLIFPPYGRMVKEFEDALGDAAGKGVPMPTDWRTPTTWPGWHLKLLELLNLILWPRYDPATSTWSGGAVSLMEPLTRSDFVLFKALRPHLTRDVTLSGGPISHYELFKIEDVRDVVDNGTVILERGPPNTLRLYLRGHADPALIETAAKTYGRGMGAKSGPFGLDLKRKLQRPRAYQVSVMMGETWFDHAHAASAVSPAMISGHCLQFSIGGVAAFYAARKAGLNAQALAHLQRHTIDGGDRRVYAGVHYPSDNVSSWITALLTLPNVCPDLDGNAWLWQAITQSTVYKAIEAAVAADGASPYAASMRVLNKLGTTPGMSVDDAIAYASPTS